MLQPAWTGAGKDIYKTRAGQGPEGIRAESNIWRTTHTTRTMETTHTTRTMEATINPAMEAELTNSSIRKHKSPMSAPILTT